MEILHDARYAIRSLLKSPGFTTVAVLSLALGIGANAAVFSLLHKVLWERLPVKDPGSLVVLGRADTRGRGSSYSYPMYRDLRDRNQVFDGILARFNTPLSLNIDGTSERVLGETVSGNYYEVLGVRPFLGRLLSPADDLKPGAHPVAVISYGFWKRRFGADRSVAGRRVLVNGHPFTIAGVSPPGFFGTTPGFSADVRIPMMMKAVATPVWNQIENRRSNWLTMMARLKPGVSLEQAQASIGVLFRHIREEEAAANPRMSAYQRQRLLETGLKLDSGTGGFAGLRVWLSSSLLALMAIVAMVLLIACANIASLLLARAAARRREISVRLALGAGRMRIVRQSLVESVVVALAGGLLGLLLSFWASQALVAAMPGSGPVPLIEVRPHWTVFGFALAASLLTGLLFGLAPALQSTNPELARTLKDQAGSVAGRGGSLVARKALIAAQVAISVVLLAGAGLFIRTLRNLETADLGMGAATVVQATLDPTLAGYDGPRAYEFFRGLIERMESLPGVRSAAVADVTMMSGSRQSWGIVVEGYAARDGEDMEPGMNVVTPRFLETLGIPVVLGRGFEARDARAKVVLINQSMARHFFGGGNPIGRKIGFRDKPDYEIIGVVRDGKYSTLREKPQRFLFIPTPPDFPATDATVYVRASGNPSAVLSAIRREAAALDRNVPVYDMKTLEEQTAELAAQERIVAWLSGLFGALAAALAAIGLYGVMAFSVLSRTREIGIRVALGARRASVLWMVLRETLLLTAAGLALGIPASLALARLVQSLLFGVSPADAATLAGAALLMAAVAIAAGYLPARRATAVDPTVALRYE